MLKPISFSLLARELRQILEDFLLDALDVGVVDEAVGFLGLFQLISACDEFRFELDSFLVRSLCAFEVVHLQRDLLVEFNELLHAVGQPSPTEEDPQAIYLPDQVAVEESRGLVQLTFASFLIKPLRTVLDRLLTLLDLLAQLLVGEQDNVDLMLLLAGFGQLPRLQVLKGVYCRFDDLCFPEVLLLLSHECKAVLPQHQPRQLLDARQVGEELGRILLTIFNFLLKR